MSDKLTDQYDGATVSLCVVDVEGDEVLSLDAGTVLIVDPDVLSLEAQLEELTLGDGDFHLGVLTSNLCLDNVVITCQRHSASTLGGQNSLVPACGGKCLQ